MISFSVFNYIIPQLYLNVKGLFNLFSLTGWLLLPSTPDPRRAMWSVSTTLTLNITIIPQLFQEVKGLFKEKEGVPLERHSRPPLYNAAPTHLLFGSTPHYTTLFSNVKPPPATFPRLGASRYARARPRQLDLGFCFVLFSSGGARGIQESCQGGVPVTD